ncbi:MAG: branched-chain amino acid transaminase [Acidiferrobacteraceae bacterium]
MDIWLDGTIRRDTEVSVSPWSHTLHYGMGVFEGIRSYDGAYGPMVFRLGDHLRRLRSSARLVGMDLVWDLPALTAAVLETLRVNGLGDAYIRPLVYYGAGGMTLDSRAHPVHLLVAAWCWDDYHETSRAPGLSTRIAGTRRWSAASTAVQAKAVGNYLNAQLALREAVSCGADEAILLDERGYLAEGPVANVFLVRNGRLYTPTTRNALEGITRDTVIVLARQRGYTVIETDLTQDDLYRADEAFFTGTACGIRIIASVNGRRIGRHAARSVSGDLRDAYSALVRAEDRVVALTSATVERWLTPVYASQYPQALAVAETPQSPLAKERL